MSDLPRYIGPLNTPPPSRFRRAWLALSAVVLLAGGYVIGHGAGASEGCARPCDLARGGILKVQSAEGGGMLYTCSRTGEIMSGIPWVGEVVP